MPRVEITVLRLDREGKDPVLRKAGTQTFTALNNECRNAMSGQPGAYADDYILVPHGLYDITRIMCNVSSWHEAEYCTKRAHELFDIFYADLRAVVHPKV